MAIYETHGHHHQSSESTLEFLSDILYPVGFDKMYQDSIIHNSVIILWFAYSSLPTFKEFTLLQNSFQISISKQKYPPIWDTCLK